MIELLRFFSLPYLRQRTLKVFLSLMGMAIGIAVFTAIELSNRAVLKGMAVSQEQSSGHFDLLIEGQERPVSDDDYKKVLNLPDVKALTPLLETKAFCRRRPEVSFKILGIDPISRGPFFSRRMDPKLSQAFLSLMAEEETMLVPQSLAQQCGISEDTPFEILSGAQLHAFRARIFDDSREAWKDAGLAFLDIATFQENFGKIGELSRLEVLLKNSKAKDWIAAHASALPSGVAFKTPEKSLVEGQDLLKAFQLNLLALALVAVFVAGFIVYNSASLSLLYRRAQLGALRALGATRSQIAGVFLLETLAAGVLSTGMGILLGWALSHFLFQSILKTVQDLYIQQAVGQVRLTLSGVLAAFGIGLGASLTGTLLPLLEIFQVAPAEAIRPQSFERHLRHHPLFLCGFSLLSFTLARFAYKAASPARPWPSFLCALGVLVGFLFLTPFLMRLVLRLLQILAKLFRLGSTQIACAQIHENPYRYSVVTAAFSLGVALWIGVGLMIFSFRISVERWIASTIRGDLYLVLKENTRGEHDTFMPELFASRLEVLEGIKHLDSIRTLPVHYGEEEIPLSAIALDELMDSGLFQIHSGSRDLFRATPNLSSAALATAVAEPFARRHGLKAGDQFSVETPWGEWPLKIGAILYDYSSERGVLYIDRKDFLAKSLDPRINGVALFLENPGEAEKFRAAIGAWPEAPPTLEIELNREIRARILNIFERTFRVTEGLKLVALFVAFLGTLATLLTLWEEKRREIGLLQALGMSPLQLKAYGLSQGFALAAIGGVLGSLSGVALCFVILGVVHYNYFAWTIPFRFDGRFLIWAMAATLATGIFASLLPLHFLTKIKPNEALRFSE